MPTKVLSIGTTAVLALRRTDGFKTDFIVQNLSANNVYFADIEATTSIGIKIIPNGSLAKDDWEGDIYLIADGATSDVRFCYQMKKVTTVGAVPAVYESPFTFLWKCKGKNV